MAAPEATVAPETVLVVVPVLNEAYALEACLRSLLAPKGWTERVTIIVADGGSTDGTQDIVRTLTEEFPNLQLAHNPERLQSAGINRAVRQYGEDHHQILVRCDAHASYPPGYIQNVAETLRRKKAESLVTPMDAVGTRPLQRAAAWIVDTKIGSGGAAHRGGKISGWVDHGHHAGFDLAWFRRLGGYDPTFAHNEDAEYDVRLRRAGGRIWLDADIRLDYLMRPTALGLLRQYWNYGRGRARTLRKHRTRPRVRQVVPVVNVLALMVSALLVAFSPVFLLWPLIYGGVLTAVSIALAVRKRDFSGLLAGPALALMHVGWGLGFLRSVFTKSPTPKTQQA